MIAGTLELQLIADVARLRSDMGQMTGIVTAATKQMEEAAKAVKEAFIGMVGGFTAAAFVEAIKQSIEYADQLNKLSQRTGIATETLSELAFAAKQSGLGTDTMTTAVKKLNVSINEAVAGNKTYQQAFANLGVSVKDSEGKTISADKAILGIADRFHTATDGATKTAYAVMLMGRAGDEMIPLLNGGSDAIQRMMDNAKKLGIAISGDFAKQAEEFNTNLGMVKAAGDALVVLFGQDLVKALSATAKAMADAAKEGGKLDAFIQGWRTLVTGDDMHKANVEMAQTADEILRLQDAIDKVNAKMRGNGAGSLANAGLASELSGLKQQLAAQQQRYDTAKNYAHVLDDEQQKEKATADAEDHRAKTTLPALSKAASGAEDAYLSLIKRIQEKINADEQQLAKGRDLTDFEKFAIKIREDEAELLKKFPGLHKAEIDALLAKAAARDKDLQVLKAEQQENANYAKDWEKSEQEMAAADKARADERDRVLQQLRDERTGLQDSIAMQQREVDLMGATDQQRQIGLGYLQAEIDAKNKIAKINEDLSLTEEARAKAIEDVKVNEALQKQSVDLKAQIDIWHSIDDTARQAFDNIGENGTNVFKDLGKSLKKELLDLLYQMTVRKYFIQIVASVTGQNPAGLLGGGGSGGGAGGLMNNTGLIGAGIQAITGSSVGASTASLGYANAVGAMGGDSLGALIAANGSWAGVSAGAGAATTFGVVDGAAGAAGLAGGAAAGAGAAGAGAAGVGGAAAAGLAAIPVAGWIALAAVALYSMFGGNKHGPKTEGNYLPYGGSYYGSGAGASAAQAQSGALAFQTQLDALKTAFGGSGNEMVGLGFSVDTKGTAPSMVTAGIGTSAGGQQAFTNNNVGRDDQSLQAAIAEEGSRAVLAGLQKSNITGIIGDYLASLGDVANKSADEVTAAIARIQKAGTEKAQLDETWFQLTHTEAENLQHQRDQELAALDISNRAMQVRVYALQDEIAAQQQAQAVYAEVSSAIDDMSKQIGSFIDKLNATSDGLGSPEDQLAAAKSQFSRQLALASGGDRDAMSSITDYADQLIKAQVSYGASGPDTQNLIAQVKSQLQALPAQLNAEEFVAKSVQDGSFLLNATLQELIARADANSAAQVAAITKQAADENAAIAAQSAAVAASAAAAAAADAARKAALPTTNGWTITESGWTWIGNGPAPGVDPFHLSTYQPEQAAVGGVFSNSLLSGITPFMTAAGKLHVAGEAGPEAVMPLVSIGGSLGVRAVGGMDSQGMYDALTTMTDRITSMLQALIAVAQAGHSQTIQMLAQVADNTRASSRAASLRAAAAPV